MGLWSELLCDLRGYLIQAVLRHFYEPLVDICVLPEFCGGKIARTFEEAPVLDVLQYCFGMSGVPVFGDKIQMLKM